MTGQWWHGGPVKSRWTVYNNKTDMPVMIDGTVEECAKAMGVTVSYFHKCCYLTKRGQCRKWCIIEQGDIDDGI